jgi:hypothetical protein
MGYSLVPPLREATSGLIQAFLASVIALRDEDWVPVADAAGEPKSVGFGEGLFVLYHANLHSPPRDYHLGTFVWDPCWDYV